MSPYCTALLLSLIVLAPAARADQLVTMHDEKQAIAFCAGGGVVWMDMMSGRYVYKGSKYYGKGKNAAYVCEVQAIQAGGQPALQK